MDCMAEFICFNQLIRVVFFYLSHAAERVMVFNERKKE